MTERYTVKLGELRLNLSNVLKKVIGEEAEIIILKNRTVMVSTEKIAQKIRKHGNQWR